MTRRSLLVHLKNEKLLLVKEKLDNKYQLPGGRLEEDESFEEGLSREVVEEIGARVKKDTLEYFKTYKYEDGYGDQSETKVFMADLEGEIKPGNSVEEIEKVLWYDSGSKINLQKILKTQLIPDLKKEGYLK